MTKIVMTCPMGLSLEQKARLEKLGTVKYYDTHPTADEWVERCQGYEVICSFMSGMRERYSELHDVFISVPFVGVSSFADPKIVKENNLTISNSPGSNSDSVAEWIVYMILTTLRKINKYTNTTETLSLPLPYPSIGLMGKNITILGKGNVGQRVGKICRAMGMHVAYFTRGDDLKQVIKDADVIVDTLSANSSTIGLLGKDFFNSVKRGSIFISVTVDSIVDMDAMLAALDSGQLSYVAHDVMNANLADTSNLLYRKLSEHKNVLATPHIASLTDVTTRIGNDMMIDNIEAWVKGKPINVFK
jgi:phosphoglycerate dehydrogenase-like enzyme